MTVSQETKTRRAEARKEEKRLAKLIPIADFVKVIDASQGKAEAVVKVDLDCVKFEGKVYFFNQVMEKLGYRPVRVTSNMLNPQSGHFCVDINCPSYCDPGCESYHSM